jgi:hypothetical protein
MSDNVTGRTLCILGRHYFVDGACERCSEPEPRMPEPTQVAPDKNWAKGTLMARIREMRDREPSRGTIMGDDQA